MILPEMLTTFCTRCKEKIKPEFHCKNCDISYNDLLALNKEVLDALKSLFEINREMKNSIAEHNNLSKNKIGLRVLNLMEEVEIETFINKVEKRLK